MNLHSSPLLLCGPFGSRLTGLLEASKPKMQLHFSVSHAALPGPVIATIGQESNTTCLTASVRGIRLVGSSR